MSTEKGSNQCEDRKMVESGRVPGKARIRASIEKLFGRVQEKIESMRVPKTCPDEYIKIVESL